jgi:hypothetical protein
VAVRRWLGALVLASTLVGCVRGTSTLVEPSSSVVALPRCDRKDDLSAAGEGGCLVQTALILGYSGAATNSFRLAYRACYDMAFAKLVQRYGGGSKDPNVIAGTYSNRAFDDAVSQRAGFDACTLALADRGINTKADG